jgi:hypothetical protein
MAEDWHKRFDEKPSDVERWATLREKYASWHREYFLFITGLFLVVCVPMFLDAALVLWFTSWSSIVGVDAKSAPMMLTIAGSAAASSVVAQLLIRRFWKRVTP